MGKDKETATAGLRTPLRLAAFERVKIDDQQSGFAETPQDSTYDRGP